MTDDAIGTLTVAQGDDVTLAAALNTAHESGYSIDLNDVPVSPPAGWLDSPLIAASIMGRLAHRTTDRTEMVAWSGAAANGDVLVMVAWRGGHRAMRRVASLDWAEEQAFDGVDPVGELRECIDRIWAVMREATAEADKQAREQGL